MHPVYVHIKKELSPFYAEEEASAMAKWISSDILHLSTLELYTGKDMNFSTKEWEELEDILRRLKQREPLQYILQEASVCGMSFSQVQKEKMFGCPECFYTFEEEVKKAYQNMNINEIYSGSLPKRLKGYKSNLVGRVETQLKLQEAIKNEEYEKDQRLPF